MGSTHSADLGNAGLGQHVFHNTLVLLGGRAGSLLLSVAASVLLARYLGRAGLGQYGALYAYLSLYAWLASFGLEPVLAREAAKRREQAGSILFTGVLLTSAFSLAASGAALLLASYSGYRGDLRLLLLFASIDVLVLAPLRMPAIVFQVDLRQWYSVGIGLLRQVLWLGSLASLALGHAGLLWVIVARTLCGVAEAALILLVVCRAGKLVRPWGFLWAEARQYLRYGFSIALSALAVGVYHRIDQVMLHVMTGDDALGGYVAAVNIAELFSALPVALMGSMLPVLSRVASDEDRFRRYLGLSFRSLMVIVCGVCAVTTPLASSLVQLIYGSKFAATAPLLAVLIWSEVPVFFGVVLTNGLIARNLQNYLPLSTVLGAGANVVLNLLLIPQWGAMGAAWATNISYCLASILVFAALRPTRPLAWVGLRIAIPPGLVALIVTGFFWYLALPALFSLPLIAVVYGTGAWLTGAVRRSEVDRIKELIGRNLYNVRAAAS